jgi:DnaJ-class molecular chaperone
MEYYIECLKCKGKGWVYESSIHDLGDVVHEDCPVCEGIGKETVAEEYFEEIRNAGALL